MLHGAKPEENYQWRMENTKTVVGNDWTVLHALRRFARGRFLISFEQHLESVMSRDLGAGTAKLH